MAAPLDGLCGVVENADNLPHCLPLDGLSGSVAHRAVAQVLCDVLLERFVEPDIRHQHRMKRVPLSCSDQHRINRVLDLRLSLLRVRGRSACLLHKRMFGWVTSLRVEKKNTRPGAMNSRHPVSRDKLEARATHRGVGRKHSSRRKGSPHIAPCV